MKKLLRAPAYTMIEILVVLAIIAVLSGLGLLAASRLQQSNRDELRKTKLIEIKDAVEAYYRINGKYPSSGVEFKWASSSLVSVGTKSITLTGSNEYSSGDTNSQQTNYYYLLDSDGYKLCVRLESSNWYGVGTSSRPC